MVFLLLLNTSALSCGPSLSPALLQTVFLTSLRKGCTLVLSYLLFPKVVTLQHVLGGAVMSVGILLNKKVPYCVMLAVCVCVCVVVCDTACV